MTMLQSPAVLQVKTKEVGKKFPLVEMFGPTIQGEGSVIGQQTYFLRFGLCDYKCTMCDSMHAVDPQQVKANAQWLTLDQIWIKFVEFRQKHIPSTQWVTFSGGNPCIHDLGPLVTRLHDEGFFIHVETQGTFCPDWLLECDSVCVSPKTPGMGEQLELDKLDAFTYKMKTHSNFSFKVVVFDYTDLQIASMIYERYMLTGLFSPDQYYLSLGNKNPPGAGKALTNRQLVDLSIENYLDILPEILKDINLCHVKFLPQWHHVLWGNQAKV